MRTQGNDLQATIARELTRLAETAKDIEAHLEDALGSDTMQETTITGIQQIDEIAQVLEHLSALLARAAEVSPIAETEAALLIEVVKLPSLQHRLQRCPMADQTAQVREAGIEFF